MSRAAALGRAPAAGVRAMRVWLPRSLRVALSRVRAEGIAAQTRRELARLARSGRPIILGPWFGEVGFELLYWAPFLAWFAHEYGVAPERLIVVSRGGSAAWYRAFAARYSDVFDFMAPEEFRRRNERRRAEFGEQKQVAVTAFDAELSAAVEASAGERCERLHPATMYRLMAPFWWGHVGVSWVTRHVRYARLRAAESPAPGLALPDRFVAVKFYFNDCFPPTEANRSFARDMVRTLSRTTPVVSLSTGLALDDHAGVDEDASDPLVAAHRFQARTNLEDQTRIVAAATRFVGTYGGFAYLAPLCGVPAETFYSQPSAFSRRHLEVAHMALRAMGTPGLLEASPTPAESRRSGR